MAETARMKALRTISDQLRPRMPGLDMARQMQIQRAAATSPIAGPGAAQQIGGAAAQMAGEQQLTAAKKGLESQTQLAQLGQREAEMGAKATTAGRELALSRDLQAHENELSKLGENVQNELFTRRNQFERDKVGREFMNDRQLADYAITKARNAEEFQNYAQTVEKASQRKMQLLKAAHDKIEQALYEGSTVRGKKLDEETTKSLATLKADIARKLKRDEAAARNRMAMWQAGGTVLGAVGGGILGIPFGPAGILAGASLGASAGGGLGTMASTV